MLGQRPSSLRDALGAILGHSLVSFRFIKSSSSLNITNHHKIDKILENTFANPYPQFSQIEFANQFLKDCSMLLYALKFGSQQCNVGYAKLVVLNGLHPEYGGGFSVSEKVENPAAKENATQLDDLNFPLQSERSSLIN